MRALSSMLCTLDLESSVARDFMFEHTAQRRPKASQFDMYNIKSFAYSSSLMWLFVVGQSSGICPPLEVCVLSSR